MSYTQLNTGPNSVAININSLPDGHGNVNGQLNNRPVQIINPKRRFSDIDRQVYLCIAAFFCFATLITLFIQVPYNISVTFSGAYLSGGLCDEYHNKDVCGRTIITTPFEDCMKKLAADCKNYQKIYKEAKYDQKICSDIVYGSAAITGTFVLLTIITQIRRMANQRSC